MSGFISTLPTESKRGFSGLDRNLKLELFQESCHVWITLEGQSAAIRESGDTTVLRRRRVAQTLQSRPLVVVLLHSQNPSLTFLIFLMSGSSSSWLLWYGRIRSLVLLRAII